MFGVMWCLAHGADVNWANPDVPGELLIRSSCICLEMFCEKRGSRDVFLLFGTVKEFVLFLALSAVVLAAFFSVYLSLSFSPFPPPPPSLSPIPPPPPSPSLSISLVPLAE